MHTAHSTQHTAHSTQHTAHSTQHTAWLFTFRLICQGFCSGFVRLFRGTGPFLCIYQWSVRCLLWGMFMVLRGIDNKDNSTIENISTTNIQ